MKKVWILLLMGVFLLALGCGNGTDNGLADHDGTNGPAGFTLIQSETEDGITYTGYKGTGAINETLNTFSDWAQARGWDHYAIDPEELGIYMDEAAGLAGFTQGDSLMIIFAGVFEEDTYVEVIVGPYDDFYDDWENGNGNGTELDGTNGPAGFTQVGTYPIDGATMTTYTGSGSAMQALNAFNSWAEARGWNTIDTTLDALEFPEQHLPDQIAGVEDFETAIFIDDDQDTVMVIFAWEIEGVSYVNVFVGDN